MQFQTKFWMKSHNLFLTGLYSLIISYRLTPNYWNNILSNDNYKFMGATNLGSYHFDLYFDKNII